MWLNKISLLLIVIWPTKPDQGSERHFCWNCVTWSVKWYGLSGSNNIAASFPLRKIVWPCRTLLHINTHISDIQTGNPHINCILLGAHINYKIFDFSLCTQFPPLLYVISMVCKVHIEDSYYAELMVYGMIELSTSVIGLEYNSIKWDTCIMHSTGHSFFRGLNVTASYTLLYVQSQLVMIFKWKLCDTNKQIILIPIIQRKIKTEAPHFKYLHFKVSSGRMTHW